MTVKILHAAAAGFEAARRLGAMPEGHREARLHGHSFVTKVRCALPSGWADFPGGEVEQLRTRLESVVGALDYAHLNESIAEPSDENLARWVRDRLDVPGIEQFSLQSTAHAGVDIDATGQAHAWRRYVFQSAHRLPNVPLGHKCGRMHGHGFEVILHARQEQAAGARPVSHDLLDACWAPLHFELNYGCLNDIPGLENPTSEVMSSWIWNRLKSHLPELSSVTVFETASCGANFDGHDYRIWKEMTLDSAVQLKAAPDGSPLRRLHGHTYTLRLHLCAPLDQVMGWTVDFGDVKEIFNPIFKALDHRPLYEMAGLDDCDSATLARWILQQTRPQLPQIERVDLYETRGCGAIVVGGLEGPACPI